MTSFLAHTEQFYDLEKDLKLKKGQRIWNTYKDIKSHVTNICNPLVREMKSGENKTGILLEIKEKLWIWVQHRKRMESFKREVSQSVGKITKQSQKARQDRKLYFDQKNF